MKLFVLVFGLLFAYPASSQTPPGKQLEPPKECKAVVHGVLFGLDGKPWAGVDLLLEPFGDYAYLLPRTKSNDLGEFRFEKICNGFWGAFVEDVKAGYPHAGRLWSKYLYGIAPPPLKITESNWDVQIDVHAPPKPALIVVHLVNGTTKATIPRGEVELRVSRERRAEPPCDETTGFTCDGGTFPVPPDTTVRLRIKAKGFREWTENGKRGKVIHVPSGETQTITAELDPIQK